MTRFPVLLVKNVAETFGDKGWEALEKSAKEFAEYRVPAMRFLVDDPENARSLGKVFDFEDNLGGLENEWIKTDAKDAIKIETKCPPAEIFKEYPRFDKWPHANGCLKINPLYTIKTKNKTDDFELVLEFPNGIYEQENSEYRQYLLQKIKMRRETLVELEKGIYSQEINRLIGKFAIIGMPQNYF